MNEQDSKPEEEFDTGEPIAELRGLEVPVSRGFRARLRARLERRQLATQAVDLGLGGILEVIRAWFDALFGALDPSADDEINESKRKKKPKQQKPSE